MLGRITAVVLISAALMAGCGRKDDSQISTTPTSLPAGDNMVSSTSPVRDGATQTSAGVVDNGGTAVAAVSPPATASGSLAVSPPASATAGGSPGAVTTGAAAPH